MQNRVAFRIVNRTGAVQQASYHTNLVQSANALYRRSLQQMPQPCRPLPFDTFGNDTNRHRRCRYRPYNARACIGSHQPWSRSRAQPQICWPQALYKNTNCVDGTKRDIQVPLRDYRAISVNGKIAVRRSEREKEVSMLYHAEHLEPISTLLQVPPTKQLRNLHCVQRRAFAQVIRYAPQVQAVINR